MPHQAQHWELIASKESPLDGRKHPRWVVERTFAWLNQNRRLVRHYERSIQSIIACIQLAMTRLNCNSIKLT